jgi:hypothetical protein
MMPDDELTLPADSQIESLLAFDQALAAGSDPTKANEPATVLRAVHECQRLLEAVWPRAAPPSFDFPRQFGRF